MPVDGQINSDRDYGSLVQRAARDKTRIRVTDAGKEVAAVIPIEDLELLEELEDRLDILEALDAIDEAHRDGGVLTWEEFASELGLS